MTRTPTRGTATALAVLMLAALALTGCSTRPGPDELYLYYSNGSVDKKQFLACVEPNTKGDWQANNDVFTLPTSLRTWNIRADGAGDTDRWIKSSSKPGPAGQPGPEVGVYATAEFYLNTNCSGGKDSPVVQFWERTGRRYGVSDSEGVFSDKGWKTMLLNTLVPAEEKAIREVTKNYSADELDANTGDVWKKMEEQLGTTFLAELKAKTGGDYFCGPTYNRASKDCPPIRISITDINFADQGNADARAKVFKAEQDAKAALIAAQQKVDVARKEAEAKKANPDYTELRRLETELEKERERTRQAQACAANPNCTVVVGAGGVNVNTR